MKSKIIELIGESFLNRSIVRGLMIVSRTPLRVSFCGGGTDLEAYYSTSQEGGCVTSVALNKYVYVTVNSRFDESVRVSYSEMEIVDDFDNMIHMQTEQSLYSHTVVGTKFTSMLPPAGTHDLKIRAYCDDEDWDDETEECGEDGDDGQFMLMDNNTGEQIVMEEVNTELSGGMHYIAKITQDTWWTQDTHELVKTQITVALGASADLTLRNVPNLTYEGENILTAISGPQFECDDGQTIAFEDANNGWEDCEDGSDEPRDDDGDGSTDQRFECDNGDTYPLDYVNDGEWHCENGEDEGEGGVSPCSDWEENEEEKEAICYETINVLYETAVVSMDAELSINLLFDFGDNPMNAMNLPLEENKYWEGELDRLTISGDLGGKIDIAKPEMSICPDLDCDQLPEMQELYSGCLLYTSPSPRDRTRSRMPSSA